MWLKTFYASFKIKLTQGVVHGQIIVYYPWWVKWTVGVWVIWLTMQITVIITIFSNFSIGDY